MGRIEKVFADGKKPAFISFTVAGDPDKTTCSSGSPGHLSQEERISLNWVYHSGPRSQMVRLYKKLTSGHWGRATPSSVFEMVREIRRESDVPIVFLTYYNIVYRRGIERFYREAHDAGVDGILIADIPVEESDEACNAALRYSIDPVFLISQTTSDERIKNIAARSLGYLYLVAVLGVTGVRDQVSEGAIDLLDRFAGILHSRSRSALASQRPHRHKYVHVPVPTV